MEFDIVDLTQEAGVMRQTAPWPSELEEIVSRLRYREGWTFRLVDIQRDPPQTHGGEGRGLTFVVVTDTVNAYRQQEQSRASHYFIVPAATYNRKSWLRWVFDCLVRVETHECMEFFQVDGVRPFSPTHGPGDDPYVVHEYADNVQSRTRYTGEVLET